MCNWPKWILPGIVTVLVLAALAAFSRMEAVEADLKDRATGALSARFAWASVDADGRDLSLSGQAPDETEIAAAIETAESIGGVRAVTSAATLPPVASPWLLEAERSGAKTVLTGHYASEASRELTRSAAEAAVPGDQIEDRRTQARGAPDDSDILAAFVLAQLAGLSDGKISISDRSVTVSGQARSVDAHESLVGALSGKLPAEGTLAALTVAPAVIETYEFRARKEAGGILLEGYMPDDATRQAVLAAAKAADPAIAVEDATRIAAGVPDGIDWSAASEFLVARLAALSSGTASIIGSDFSIEGRAKDTLAFEAVGQVLTGDLPAGLVLANVAIGQPVISPWTWSLDSAANRLTLGGYAPDQAAAQRNVAEARTRFGSGTEVVDQQKLGAGAPEDIGRAYALALQAASRLESPAIRLSQQSIEIAGQALTGVAANEIRAAFAHSLPAGWNATVEISVRPAAPFVDANGCQAGISALMQGNAVRFGSGSAEIEDNSFGLLDRLVFAIRRCPELRVEIGGHTDSDGDEEANLRLSETRAAAVRDYLVRAGILYSRLLAKGFGESRPLADNATPEGKAANRRIEFIVVQ